MNNSVTIFLLVFLLISLPLRSEEGEKKIISLNECIKIALQNHTDIHISEENKKKALANYKEAKGNNSLAINGEVKTVEYLKTNSSAADAVFKIPGQDTNIGLFAGLTATYSLYNAQREELLDSAKMEIDLAKIEAQIKVGDIMLTVKKNYLGYYLACQNLILQEQLLDKAVNKHKQAQMLFQNGARPILDVSKAEIDVNQIRLDLEKAKNKKSIMQMNLMSSMGLKYNQDQEIIPQSFDTLSEIKYSLDDLYMLMDMYNPSIKQIRAKKKISRMQISVERAAHMPRVNIVFALGYENTRLYGITSGMDTFSKNFKADSWTPSFNGALQAFIPVYSGGSISARVDAALAEYNKMVYSEDRVVLDIKNSLITSYRGLSELMRQYNMSDLVIENARKHLLLAQRSYENGVGSQLELKDAEMSVIQAEQEKLNSRYTYYEALASISNLVGLEEAQLCK